jgi:hypothetical protein
VTASAVPRRAILDYAPANPPKLVYVRRDDAWYDGELRAWWRDAVGCLG